MCGKLFNQRYTQSAVADLMRMRIRSTSRKTSRMCGFADADADALRLRTDCGVTKTRKRRIPLMRSKENFRGSFREKTISMFKQREKPDQRSFHRFGIENSRSDKWNKLYHIKRCGIVLG